MGWERRGGRIKWKIEKKGKGTREWKPPSTLFSSGWINKAGRIRYSFSIGVFQDVDSSHPLFSAQIPGLKSSLPRSLTIIIPSCLPVITLSFKSAFVHNRVFTCDQGYQQTVYLPPLMECLHTISATGMTDRPHRRKISIVYMTIKTVTIRRVLLHAYQGERDHMYVSLLHSLWTIFEHMVAKMYIIVSCFKFAESNIWNDLQCTFILSHVVSE